MKEIKFFYIIKYSGQIHEIKFTPEKYQGVLKSWDAGNIIVLSELPASISAGSIQDVFIEGDEYENYIAMATPKHYIKNGFVKDGKTGDVIRTMKWKQEEMDSKKKLEAPKKRELTEEEKEANRKAWLKFKEETGKIFNRKN